MQEEYKYYIRYKLFSENEYIEFKFDGNYQDLKDTIYQLWRWFARFNGNLCKWFELFENIQISEQNYDFKSQWKHYENHEISDEERERMGADYYELPICLEDEIKIWGYSKDITNQLFHECNISIDSLWWKKGISLWDDKIFVNGIPFDISKNTKLYELLDIILRVRYYKNKDSISYEDVTNYYMQDIRNELKKDDLTHIRIRDILKSKLENIQQTLWLSELPISAQKWWIIFRI